jgi:hypothetical protein
MSSSETYPAAVRVLMRRLSVVTDEEREVVPDVGNGT